MDTLQQPIQGGENISDEKRKELLFALNRLKAQAADTKMRMNASNINVEMARKKELQKMFGRMQMNGVDLRNRESVAGFINKVKQNNPNTAQLFESSMGYLLGENNNMNNINQNETLPQNPSGYNN